LRTEIRRRPLAALALLAGVTLAGAACRQDMHNKGRLKPYEESRFFRDGRLTRPLPAGTVAQGFLRDDTLYYTGLTEDGSFLTQNPEPLSAALLARGRERFDIYCSPCHSRIGDGRGMIVQRGFKQPVSFHDPRLRETPDGYFFDVMTNGFAQMPSYASQVPPADRWAIVAYIRALQLSQNVPGEALDARDRELLEAGIAPTAPIAAPAATAPHGGH
jgi:mono/diheme cytochrome c family protein